VRRIKLVAPSRYLTVDTTILYHFDQFGRHAFTGHFWAFSGSVRAPGVRAASGAHHIRQVAERKISSTCHLTGYTLAELNEMVQ